MESIRDKTSWMVKNQVIIDYLIACTEATSNEEKFQVFKQNPKYTAILEHCRKEVGVAYYNLIKDNHPWLLDIDALFENDTIGNPKLESFGAFYCSTSTMQYIGVLSNLINKFGALHDRRIVEIGGGYGGQCKIISSCFHVNNYYLIDLLEPSLLQAKYLKRLGVERFTTYTDLDYLQKKEIDLVISNYALSEILEPLQTEYVEKILLNSKHGYITCNREIKASNLLEEKFYPSFKIEKDIKGEGENNFIISW